MSQNIENMYKVIAFYHLQEHLKINNGKKVMDTAIKTGIDATKAAPKIVVQKTAEATGDLSGNKVTDKLLR